MKKTISTLKGLLVLTLGAFVLGATGCKPNDGTDNLPGRPTLEIKVNGATDNSFSKDGISQNGETINIGINSNRDWELTANTGATWVTVNPTSGAAKLTNVAITVAANEGDIRDASLTFKTVGSPSTTRIVRISQNNKDGVGKVVPGEGKISIKDLKDAWSSSAIIPANTWIEGTIISDVDGKNQDTRSIYVWDSQAPKSGLLIYQIIDTGNHTLALNSTVKVVLDGATMAEYQGAPQITGVTLDDVTAISTITAITEPVEVANYAALSADYHAMLVKMPGVKADAAHVGLSWGKTNANNTLNFTDANSAAFKVFFKAPYNNEFFPPFIDNVVPSTSGTIAGIASFATSYGVQLQPRNFSDVEGMGVGVPVYNFTVGAASPSKVAAEGGDATVAVTTGDDVAWTATVKEGAANGTVSAGATGTGNGEVKVTFGANSATEDRTVVVTIATVAENVNGTKSYDVTFTQAATGTDVPEEKIAVFDIPNMGFANQASWGAQTINGITITSDGGGNGNSPKYYTSGTALRTYSKNTLTFTGGNIINISWENGTRSDGISVNTGVVSGNAWTGSATSVVFTTTPTTTSTQHHFTKITVTYN